MLHLLELPLDINLITSVQVKLAEMNYKLSDYKNALDVIEKINIQKLPGKFAQEIEFIQASSLVGAGEFNDGIARLKSLSDRTKEPSKNNKLKIEMAYAEFELGNYSKAVSYAETLINDTNLDSELIFLE